MLSTKRLFGTDGIRGEAGAFPLDAPTLERTGWAIATVLAKSGGSTRVLIGRDTRESGVAIETAISRGLIAGGVKPTSGGVLTTPAVAYLTHAGLYDAGIVISASHNPFRDNGVKVFSADGFKLPDAVESQIEQLVLDGDDFDEPMPEGELKVYRNGSDPLLKTRYLSHLRATVPAGFTLEGRTVVLDCANGAASALAPEIFRRLGATVHLLSATPDGRNINDGSGALHPQALAAAVLAAGAFLGAAFDGDADRCVLVDETGVVRDGDDVLAVAATAMGGEDHLTGKGVVSTVMANLGLENYVRGLGGDFARTAVGDKYVIAEMRATGAVLGGEQSGHVIFLDHATTGDGVLTALHIAAAVVASGKPLSELASCWTRLPQVLRNVRVRERIDLTRVPEVKALLAEIEAKMQGRGRLLVRYSGTEPLLRIMLEGEDLREIESHAEELAAAVALAIGAGG